MSIATKTGDAGTTGLMYNRRVSKCHPRVEAGGAVDELTAGLGLARASTTNEWLTTQIGSIQRDLITLMGELATDSQDLDRYVKDGFGLVTPAMTTKLDQLVTELESGKANYKGWAIPGAAPTAAALDLARTACRRAERRVCAIKESGELANLEIVIFLNRLADVLWLLARQVEEQGTA